ncbi:uncharacterized protein G2W53_006959 [Senna tora]|uniref:Uncharacterized protein n=1 Tax=Senna tora TaxID=362788 RepID=A0A834X513_9FABA|nr:uncharacterized protein G2W53_006959 [Senna tora]
MVMGLGFIGEGASLKSRFMGYPFRFSWDLFSDKCCCCFSFVASHDGITA